MGTLNWQTMILDDYRVDDSYWENAKLELSKEVEWITQSELYKKVKRNDGSGNDIILSVPVSAVLETIKQMYGSINNKLDSSFHVVLLKNTLFGVFLFWAER